MFVFGDRLLVASDGIEYSATLGVKIGDEAGLGEWQFGRHLEGASVMILGFSVGEGMGGLITREPAVVNRL